MGIRHQAKHGGFYERRRTIGGRYYTVSRGSNKEEARQTAMAISILFGVLLVPFTCGLSLALPIVYFCSNARPKKIHKNAALPQSEQKEFLHWLEMRMQSVGYTVETAPSYLKDAYASHDPKDLNQLVWQEWWEYKKTHVESPPLGALSKKAWQVLIHGCVASGGNWPGDYNYWTSKELAETHAATKVEAGWKEVQVVEVDPPGSSALRPTIKNQWRQPSGPQINIGPRGGRYTMENTKDGRPYRRYF
jgi:hypothetical protein